MWNPHNVKFWVRVGLGLSALGMAVFFFTRYGAVTLDARNDALYPFAAPGATTLAQKHFFRLRAGDRVLYEDPVTGEFRAGRIRAAPGEPIRVSGDCLILSGDARCALSADQRERWKNLDGSVIGAEDYLIINENLSSTLPDSRARGLIPRKRIRCRILMQSPF